MTPILYEINWKRVTSDIRLILSVAVIVLGALILRSHVRSGQPNPTPNEGEATAGTSVMIEFDLRPPKGGG